jgi:hypothetical protein
MLILQILHVYKANNLVFIFYNDFFLHYFAHHLSVDKYLKMLISTIYRF